jgi:transcriptional regulator with XRE-family HTH domain
MTILLREAIGDRLRHARTTKQCTLRDISRAARVSLGYLSEVERGQKEASSELLAAICEALGLSISELLTTVASDITVLEGMQGVGKADSFEAEFPEPVAVAERGPSAGVPGERAMYPEFDTPASLDGGSLLSEVDASTLAAGPLSDCLPPHFAAPWPGAPSSGMDRHGGVATGVTVAA